MVIRPPTLHHGNRGALIVELVVAVSIIAIALVPLAYSFNHEQKVLSSYYHRALALEIIDGELEVLAAGEWRAFQPGIQTYEVNAASAVNLPKGAFTLTLDDHRLSLEWKPEKRGKGGPVTREVRLP